MSDASNTDALRNPAEEPSNRPLIPPTISIPASTVAATDKSTIVGDAKIKYLPSISKYYPAALKNRGIGGAISIVQVCVNAEARIVGEPRVVMSSYFAAFDAMSVRVAKLGKYTSPERDGKAYAGCVSYRLVGQVRVPLKLQVTAEFDQFVSNLSRRLPITEKEILTSKVRFANDALVWEKSYFKIDILKTTEEERKELFDQTLDLERELYCSIPNIKKAFDNGLTVISNYKASNGNLFSIVTNAESCNFRPKKNRS